MKLEIGMFVRTINNKAVGNGIIGKIRYINERDFNGKTKQYYSVWTDNKNWFEITNKENVKSSFNLIDLIEVGDYVNGGKVYEYDNELILNQIDGSYIMLNELKQKYIKEILTHEQYNSNKYVIGDDKNE